MTPAVSLDLPTIPPAHGEGTPTPFLPSDPAATPQVAGYKVLGVLGSGGMGIVYKALDEKLNRVVALKVLRVGTNAGAEDVARFRGEAETLASLQHPNIVQVFDLGSHNGWAYLVMELVQGGTLEQKLAGQAQPPSEAARLVETLARAINAAHDKEIVHRDLKPANVLLTDDGVPKITDFGLAKRLQAGHGLTHTGAILGTPSYMSPEQAKGRKNVGPATDVWALGAILYECLTGRPPFRAETPYDTILDVIQAEPVPIRQLQEKVPRELEIICLKCLQKVPTDRYDNALALAAHLRDWLEGRPVRVELPSRVSWERTVRVFKWALVLAGALVVALVVVLALVMRDQIQQRKIAQAKALADDAARARDDARKSLQNLRVMMQLLQGDHTTAAGLAQLEQKLEEQAARLATDGSDPEEAMVLAEFYFTFARHWRRLGEVDRAVEMLGRAEKLAAQGARPGAVDAQVKRARIYQERGLLRTDASRTAGSPEAAEDCRKALALLADVRQPDAGKPEFIRLRAAALHDLARALAREAPASDAALRKNNHEAEKSYLQALALLRGIIQRRDAVSDEDRGNLARTLGCLGDLYFDTGRISEADEVYRESHELRVALAEAKPRNYERKYQLARSWANLGWQQAYQRNLRTGLDFYRESEKLRRELHQKQPDNKEYALELAGILNRIAELELLVAEPKQDVAVLSAAEGRLRAGEALLKGLLDVLQEDLRQNRGLLVHTYSPLAECLALQARAGLIRYDLSRHEDKAAREHARAAARKAGDAYAEVLDRRRPQPLTPDETYQQVAAELLSLEIYKDTIVAGKETDGLSRFYEARADRLKTILRGNLRRLSRDEIWRDRAFRSVRERPEYRSLLRPGATESSGKDGSAKDDRPALVGQDSKDK